MDKFIIPHADIVKPYRQGQLDTLCGLYSAINAIRLTAYPQKVLTKYHAQIMMEEGLEYLGQRESRILSALSYGMGHNLKQVLTMHLIHFAAEEWSIKIEMVKPYLKKSDNPRPIIMSFIEDSIKAGNPVGINIKGHHKHYTIISGYSQQTFRLYDSDGLTSIKRDLISIKGDKEGVRHELVPKGVFSLTC